MILLLVNFDHRDLDPGSLMGLNSPDLTLVIVCDRQTRCIKLFLLPHLSACAWRFVTDVANRCMRLTLRAREELVSKTSQFK